MVAVAKERDNDGDVVFRKIAYSRRGEPIIEIAEDNKQCRVDVLHTADLLNGMVVDHQVGMEVFEQHQ